MAEFRITVALNQFFSDYRSTCRLFVHKEITTISDLIKYICARFGIKNNFYLTSNNVYLPSTEDIRVLKEDEIICVNANRKSLQKDVGLEINVETLEEQVRYKKAKRIKLDCENVNVKNVTNVDVQTSPTKILNAKEGSNELVLKTTPNSIELLPVADHKLNTEKYIKKKKKKVPKNTDEVANINPEIFPPLEDKTSDSAIEPPLTTSFKKVTRDSTNELGPYGDIHNFKMPRIKPIKLMKISTVPKLIKPVYVHDVPASVSLWEVNENIATSSPLTVPKELSTCEQPLPNQTASDDETVNTYTENQTLQNGENISIESNSKNVRDWYPKSEIRVEKTNLSRLQQAKQLLLQQIKAKFDNLTPLSNKLVTSATNSLNLDNNISHLDCSRSLSDGSKVDAEDSVDFTLPLKRKRKRYRTKRNKTLHADDISIISYVEPELPSTKSRNLATHVRFDDGTSNQMDDVVENNIGTSNDSKIVKNNELQSLPTVSKEILKIGDILKYPILSNTTLKEGDIIAFKMLVMSQSYSPTISDYIIGCVLSNNSDTNNLMVKILEGKEHCRSPEGKFLIEEDGAPSENETVELLLDQILEPRLLYP